MKPFDCAQDKYSFPEKREGLTEWKAEIGDCVQDLCSEALFPKCSFSRNEGECAEWIRSNRLLYI
ncbi:MAG: hypothetical protein CL528_00575 [Aequorivita sp.]|nr:hypothetical protein [Aequorivita sp.]HBC04258.1 hypothetical protein [Aequorivita sp.]